MELRSEDLSCYLNNIRSVGLWKRLYDHWFANKAYFSDIAVNNISKSFTHKMAAKASWHRNYVTVALCIQLTDSLHSYPACECASCYRDVGSINTRSSCGIVQASVFCSLLCVYWLAQAGFWGSSQAWLGVPGRCLHRQTPSLNASSVVVKTSPRGAGAQSVNCRESTACRHVIQLNHYDACLVFCQPLGWYAAVEHCRSLDAQLVPRAVPKRMNGSRCRLGRGLGLTQETTYCMKPGSPAPRSTLALPLSRRTAGTVIPAETAEHIGIWTRVDDPRNHENMKARFPRT